MMKTTFFKALPVILALVLPVAVAAEQVPQSRAQVKLSFAPLVKKTSPGVVNIYAKKIVKSRSRGLFSDPFFERFFGRGFGGSRTREKVENSLGSGVIVSSDGLVVTNNHVIGGATEIRVVMTDRREYDAKIVLTDKRTDIAVLRMEGVKEVLPALEMGDSDSLEVGDLVLAIGNPFGVGQTITSGIVSGLARSSVGMTDFRSFIQTDAAINPGNSGGALIDLDGRVVGINTVILSKSGGSLGIGFAVPISMVRSIVDSAVSGKPLMRPWLGFAGRDVNQEIADALGMERPDGVLVEDIYVGGPAAQSGLRPGDVVTGVDKWHVEDAQNLRFRLATQGTGGNVKLHFLRNQQEMSAEFALIAPPEVPARDEYVIPGQSVISGLKVVNLSPAVSDELGMPTDLAGVMVIGIRRGSVGSRIGIQPRDILAEVNGFELKSVDDVRRVVSNPPDEWRLVLQRGGRKIALEVR